MSGYIMLTNKIPQEPYQLRSNYFLRAVKPSDEMFKGFSLGVPRNYPSIMALTWRGDRHPESYKVYRKLVFFHSFVSDDPETFEYSVERAIKEPYQDSEFTYIDDPTDGIDFDRFPVPVPILPHDNQYSFTNKDADQQPEVPFDNDYQAIDYKKAFQHFSESEGSKEQLRRQLYNQICSYVFIRGLWDISNIGLLYKNEDLSATFFIAILESVFGEPDKCDGELKCTKCGKIVSGHNNMTWREYLNIKLNDLESGWGDVYVDAIIDIREGRHRFAHTASYMDILQELWNIHDKEYYYGERLSESDLKKEESLFTDRDKLDILERTVRKGLARKLLEKYA